MSNYISASYDSSELSGLQTLYGTGEGTASEIILSTYESMIEQATSSKIKLYDYSNYVNASPFIVSNLSIMPGRVLDDAGDAIETTATTSETSY